MGNQSALMKNVWFAVGPLVTWVHVPLMAIGVELLVWLPVPNCPEVFWPHAAKEPSDRRAMQWLKPGITVEKPRPWNQVGC